MGGRGLSGYLEDRPQSRYGSFMPTATHSVAIFLAMVQAVRATVPMKPRSANDKEYFAQDWFIQCLRASGLQYQQLGRNSYPDFWAYDDNLREGYEIKSLAFVPPTPRQAQQGQSGKPARKDIDFNSTIPSGRKNVTSRSTRLGHKPCCN
jgi:hypothetical protein